MANFLKRRSGSVVGLDIQDHALTAATTNGSGFQAFSLPLAPGIVTDGAVADSKALAAAIKAFFARNKLNGRVRLGVAGNRVVVRVLDLPMLDNQEEMDAAIRFEAGENLPMPLDEAAIDYVVTESFENGSGRRNQIVLVAAPKAITEEFAHSVKSAGLRLEGIDLAVFALIRALYRPVARLKGESSEPDRLERSAVAYLHLGAVTSLALAQGDRIVFGRSGDYGFDQIVDDLCARTELDPAQAQKLVFESGPDASDSSEHGPVLCEVLSEAARQVAHELQVAFDYYADQEDSCKISAVAFTGPGAAIPGLAAEISLLSPVAVEVCAPRFANASGAEALSASLAYGLAVGSADETD